MKKILMTLFVLIFFAGCGQREGETGDGYNYCLFNGSSHRIDFKAEYGFYELRDKMFLEPGESVYWSGIRLGGFRTIEPFMTRIDALTIVYDHAYAINAIELQDTDRDFLLYTGWRIEEIEGEKYSLATYTFTDDDYAYAVEHGTVVGE